MQEPVASELNFSAVVEQRLTRRGFLGTVGAAAMAMSLEGTSEAKTATAPGLGFNAITPVAVTDTKEREKLFVPDNHEVQVLLKWGDPVEAGAPEFDPANLTEAAQAKQFGYNCDFVGFLPLPLSQTNATHGLLIVNHEYTNPELMFSDYVKKKTNPTPAQVNVELAAHGLSVVEIMKDRQGQWKPIPVPKPGENTAGKAMYNRRITAKTPMQITGPAKDHPWLKTKEDPQAQKVLGTLNNCSGGKTPWGTILSGEENFHQYFGNADKVNDPEVKAAHLRYGLPKADSDYRWETTKDKEHVRFDCAQEPHEPFRFGWVVEIDPLERDAMPCKRTALGRFRHEAATVVVTPEGKVVLYSGDDEKFEYVYKFVSAKPYHPADRKANLQLLDEGTLYVAKFHPDGTGTWLKLVHGEGPLTAANGFASQADVLVKTRQAADRLEATKMDRPEDIEANPLTNKVYIVLTNNVDRGKRGKPGLDKVNPRFRNQDGHIVELTEDGEDHAATTFRWNIFLLCGDPREPSTYFAGFPKDQVSPISCPDNVTFDLSGNLWIASDGAPNTIDTNDGLFAVPVAGPRRGELKQFLSAPHGSEVCGPEFTPDNTTLFVAIQHPGENEEGKSTYKNPNCRWPHDEKKVPRPSVVAIRHKSGGRVGEA